jgi:hypothetical protein
VRLEPGQELGAYRIIEQIGRGGMATVYKAHQPSLSRYVAIKVLPDYLADDPDFQARFRAEAVAVAALRHPNIPAIYDYGVIDGVTVIVSDYIDGGTLAEQLGRPLPPDYCVRLLEPVASALDYAHARGVLHRDVKPQNILIARDGRPLLNDFGLARMMESEQRISVAGEIMGTPEYMSPEQCSGGDVGPAADVYSLAMVAYQMLTGVVPFSAATPAAVLMAQIQNTLPPPRSINPQLDEAVESALLTGLAKEAGNRPRSASLLINGLRGGSMFGAATGAPASLAPAAQPVETIPRAAAVPVPAAAGTPPRAVAATAPARRFPAGLIAGLAVLALALLGGGGYAIARSGMLASHASAPPPDASPSPGAPGILPRNAAPRGPMLPAGLEGQLIWAARFDGGGGDFVNPYKVGEGSAAVIAPEGSQLKLQVVRADGHAGVSWAAPAQDRYVAEMRASVRSGSSSTFLWLIRSGDAQHAGIAAAVDLAAGTVRLQLEPANGGSPQDQGDPVQVPGLLAGRSFGLEATTEPEVVELYVNGVKVDEYNEQDYSAPTAEPGFAIFGHTGTVLVSDARVYAMP